MMIRSGIFLLCLWIGIVPGLPATNSTSPLTGTPAASIEQNHLTMTYRRAKAATNFSFTVGWSSNLMTWNSGAAYIAESVSADDGTNETHVAQDKTTIDSRPMAFLRLKVIRKIQGAKVVCFGDSITLGYGVPVAQTWVNQLRTDSAWTW